MSKLLVLVLVAILAGVAASVANYYVMSEPAGAPTTATCWIGTRTSRRAVGRLCFKSAACEICRITYRSRCEPPF